MAYEVVKTIGKNRYRYRVVRERDESGKPRNRWTYLGRVVGEGDAPAARAARPNARLRLLDAAEALIGQGEPGAVTADAIARTAGVAHGTFYRYFRDRSDALEQLARHLRDARGIGDDRQLDAALETRDAARAAIRAWIVDRLQSARERRVAYRAWYALIASDPRLNAYREERRDQTRSRLAAFLQLVDANGVAPCSEPEATAYGLLALVEGITRSGVLEHDELDDARISAAADIAERAVFGRLDSGA